MISLRQVDGNNFDNEIAVELGYDFIALQHKVTELIPQLIPEESHVFRQVLSKIESGSEHSFFSTPLEEPENVFAELICDASQKKTRR
ncbi:hypothetical protein TNCV_1155201 [Trichonephila clavipes]|nr:hypothetical protein TNCV_1155201 [Trichonephila clavipes]